MAYPIRIAKTTKQANEMPPKYFFIAEKYKMIIIMIKTVPTKQSLNCIFLSLNKKIVKRERAADKPVKIINGRVLLAFKEATPLIPVLVTLKKGSQ